VAGGCARADSRLDTAKICSNRRVDADRPRLRAVFGGGKRFYTAWTEAGHRFPAFVGANRRMLPYVYRLDFRNEAVNRR
jgi:hypothetical protein